MNIDQLKAFYRVALTGSFTKAAGMLYITQSAVSQQVQALEHALGTTLFDRSGRKVFLTSAGETLLGYANRLFDLHEEILAELGHQQSLKKGRINIASTRVLGTYYLPKVVGRFNRRYPGIEIDLRLGNSHRIVDIILSGEVDFGFAGKIRNHARLAAVAIHREKLLVVSSPNHELAARRTIRAADLVKTPFIWREKGTQTHRVVKRWFNASLGRSFPGRSIALENVESTKRIVEEGYGVTIIPEAAVKREIGLGVLKPLEVEGFDLSVDFHLFHFKGKVFSRAAAAFLEMLADIRLFSHIENLRGILKANGGTGA